MTNPISFVFFGTSDFSGLVLDELENAGYLPQLIVTAPDRRAGRGMKLVQSSVKAWAAARGIPTLQPEKFKKENVADTLRKKAPRDGFDVFILASYGKIIPQSIIQIPKHGTLNVHPSLLPLHRGASPLQAQILADDPRVGTTIMLTDNKMDHGPLLTQKKIQIDEHIWPPTYLELEEMLGHESGKLLAETLPLWVAGDIAPQEQDHEAATYCSLVKKSDGLLDLAGDPRSNFLKIRAYAGWPRTYFFLTKNSKKIRVIVTEAEYADGNLILKKVIPEGKREIPYRIFMETL